MNKAILYAAGALLSVFGASEASAQDFNRLKFPLNEDRIRAIAPGAYRACAAEAAEFRSKRPGEYSDDYFVKWFTGPEANEHNMRSNFEYLKPLIGTSMADYRHNFGWCGWKYLIENY